MAVPPDPRTLYFLGRRVERLAFTGILLIVLSFVDIYFATANIQLIADRSSTAIATLLNKMKTEEKRLTTLYHAKPAPPALPVPPVPQPLPVSEMQEQQKLIAQTREKLGLPPLERPKPPKPRKPPTPSPKPETYREAIGKIVIEVSKESEARAEDFSSLMNPTKPPSELIKTIQSQKDVLDNKPTTVWGIQTPRLFQLQYAGQDYRIPLDFLSRILAVALAPLVFAWLCALYLTRQRELMMISDIDDYKLAFPHIFNFLPVSFDKVETRMHQRHVTRYRNVLSFINRFFHSMLRSCAVLLLALPMVAGCTYAIYLIWDIETSTTSTLYISGALLVLIMFIQILALVIQEWTVLHRKEFYE